MKLREEGDSNDVNKARRGGTGAVTHRSMMISKNCVSSMYRNVLGTLEEERTIGGYLTGNSSHSGYSTNGSLLKHRWCDGWRGKEERNKKKKH